MNVSVAHCTCVGARARNEDRIAVEQRHGHWCLVLSDGAGGHGHGELAAELVVERVLAGFRSRPPVDPADLSELVLDAHDAVVAGQRELASTGARAAMHATVVVLMIDTSTGLALWGHVGDSRLYVWRDGMLQSVTRDDSVVQRLLDAGLVDASRQHEIPNRSVLLTALGSVDEIVPHISQPFELQQADSFLLCSDGWWQGMEAGLLSESLAMAGTPESWLATMLAHTRSQADPRQDNYSAIACWIGDLRVTRGARR